MPSLAATRPASMTSSRVQQGRAEPVASAASLPLSQSCMVAPITSKPCSSSRAAATEESTPPLMAISTRPGPVSAFAPAMLLFTLLQGQFVMTIHFLHAEQFVPLRFQAPGDVFHRFAVIEQKKDFLLGFDQLQGQLGLDKIGRAADAAQIYSFHSGMLL